ncbi:MAG TPA: response regulator [Patescibacteria group bacterium]|nr:response regulator [Patescibacteria group bacterium]
MMQAPISKHPFHILIVDDEPGDVHLIKTAITEGRFLCQASIAKDGVEAMAFLAQEDAARPDLILLDLNMPRMDGREVLKALKADARLSSIPVVVMTTSDVESDILTSYHLGAAGFVTKPVGIEELFQAVHLIEDYWIGLVRCP